MKNESPFNIHEDFLNVFDSPPNQEESDLLKFKKWISSLPKEGGFKFSLLVSLVQHIDQSLDVIKKIANLSRGKFSDKTFESHFQRMIQEEVEKVDWLLRSVLQYVKVNATETKTNTIHTLLEQSLKKHQAQWEKKRIRVFKKFEKDLPETIVPDEHLQYIIDSLLNYATRWMTSGGFIGLMTRLVSPSKESTETDPLSLWTGKQVELSILFDGFHRTEIPLEPLFQEKPSTKKELLDFELRLVDDVVRKNRGVMETATDEQKGRTYLSLKFPVERRKILSYPSAN